MFGNRKWLAALVGLVTIAIVGVSGTRAGDIEEPWDLVGPALSFTSFGEYTVEVFGAAEEPVDAWDTAEPFMTVYLTTDVPSDTTVQVSVGGTVNVGAEPVLADELP